MLTIGDGVNLQPDILFNVINWHLVIYVKENHKAHNILLIIFTHKDETQNQLCYNSSVTLITNQYLYKVSR